MTQPDKYVGRRRGTSRPGLALVRSKSAALKSTTGVGLVLGASALIAAPAATSVDSSESSQESTAQAQALLAGRDGAAAQRSSARTALQAPTTIPAPMREGALSAGELGITAVEKPKPKPKPKPAPTVETDSAQQEAAPAQSQGSASSSSSGSSSSGSSQSSGSSSSGSSQSSGSSGSGSSQSSGSSGSGSSQSSGSSSSSQSSGSSSSSQSSGSSSSSGSVNTGAYQSQASGLGLGPNASAVYSAVRSQFPHLSNIGGYRPGDGGDHGSGRAVDIMTSGASGDALASYLQANAGRLNITYIIWKQRIWMPGRDWRYMSDRGSATANHYDHVHVSVQ